MKTKEEFDEFSKWIDESEDVPAEVKGMQVDCKHIEGAEFLSLAWWAHKLEHHLILPAIMPLLMKINPEHWAITQAMMNMGESQHHWTNTNMGIKLSLVKAIER